MLEFDSESAAPDPFVDPGVATILELFARRGHSAYGGEPVSQVEHALQAAANAEVNGAAPALIAAALLHDVGHLLHELPDDAPEQGIDDRHEIAGLNHLVRTFPPAVTEPVRLHVAAKRYLCAIDAEYLQCLSGPSATSLALQGGPMSAAEVAAFERNPYAADAVRLRRWDDAAKDPDSVTPPLSHFAPLLHVVARGEGAR